MNSKLTTAFSRERAPRSDPPTLPPRPHGPPTRGTRANSSATMTTAIATAIAFFAGANVGRLSHRSGNCVPIRCPPQPTCGTVSAFDVMNRRLYDRAAAPVRVRRSSIDEVLGAGGVNSTGGGLMESDRKLLAGTYADADSVFEFGLGESTHVAARMGVPRLTGVDSSAEWIAIARDGVGTSDGGIADHFRFHFADIGALVPNTWGRARHSTLAKIPYNYQSGPLHGEGKAFDVYLVDGRYRVACACAAFLHAKGRGGDMTRVAVLFHDWDREEDYHVVKEIADVVEESEKLALLRLKKDATEGAVTELWERYKYVEM